MGEAETIKIVDAFIQRWQGQEGGQERANYALFLTELCDLIGVGHPEPLGLFCPCNALPKKAKRIVYAKPIANRRATIDLGQEPRAVPAAQR
jgi:hypothetical protein